MKIREEIRRYIKNNQGKDGVDWDVVLEDFTDMGVNSNMINAEMNLMVDIGLLYEPVLGKVKVV